MRGFIANATCLAGALAVASCRRVASEPAPTESRVAPAPLPVASTSHDVIVQSAPSPAPPREAAAPGTRSFGVRTPDDWIEVPPAGPRDAWTFHNAEGTEQLTVSDVPHVPLPDERTALAACDHIIEAHRQAERQLSTSGLQLGEVHHGEIGHQLGARWAGFEPENGHRAWTLVVCTNTRFEVFYYEALDATADHADSRARALFDTVSVR